RHRAYLNRWQLDGKLSYKRGTGMRQSMPAPEEKFLLRRGWIPAFTGMTKFQTAFKRYGCVNNGRVGFSLLIPAILAVFAFLSFSLFLPFTPNPAN
ncbi:hypothetical protein, partial [Neisseria meningitidis]|uniref:hypothetical protein n=1 Tax=Neisseria meningitidis TaxID=487 RepID=UPI0022AEAB74